MPSGSSASFATKPARELQHDRGAQFTTETLASILEIAEVRISMDGRGRALENVFVGWLWHTVKWEHIYPMDYDTVPELATGLQRPFQFYHYERFHHSLKYRTPVELSHAS